MSLARIRLIKIPLNFSSDHSRKTKSKFIRIMWVMSGLRHHVWTPTLYLRLMSKINGLYTMCNVLCGVWDVSCAYWFRSNVYTCDYAYICMLMIVGSTKKATTTINNRLRWRKDFLFPIFLHSEHFRIGCWNVRTINANAYSTHRYLWWNGFNFRVAIYFCWRSPSGTLFHLPFPARYLIINYDCSVYVFIKM